MRYIGSKTLLLNKIETILDENITKKDGIFCDAFSGTSTVGKHFKKRYSIISNDLLFFSYVLQYGHIKINKQPSFSNLSSLKIKCPLEYFNSLDVEQSMFASSPFIYDNYSPTASSERMYLSNKNALKIDFIRQSINSWHDDKLVSDDERYYLLAVLLEAVPYVSNISGVYGAYLKHWDKRALKDITLKHIDIHNNEKDNQVYNENSNELIENIKGDILYIDPPYNSRQYMPNYHLLETIAKYDNPEIYGKTGLRPYDDKKSLYCQKANVLDAFDDLIKKAKFENIVVSYSTDGIMSQKEMEEILLRHGIRETLKTYKFDYRKYKSKNEHKQKELKELIFFIKKDVSE